MGTDTQFMLSNTQDSTLLILFGNTTVNGIIEIIQNYVANFCQLPLYIYISDYVEYKGSRICGWLKIEDDSCVSDALDKQLSKVYIKGVYSFSPASFVHVPRHIEKIREGMSLVHKYSTESNIDEVDENMVRYLKSVDKDIEELENSRDMFIDKVSANMLSVYEEFFGGR